MLLYFVTPEDEKNKYQKVENDNEKLERALAQFKAAKEREKQLLM